jgi:hypothetical protein
MPNEVTPTEQTQADLFATLDIDPSDLIGDDDATAEEPVVEGEKPAEVQPVVEEPAPAPADGAEAAAAPPAAEVVPAEPSAPVVDPELAKAREEIAALRSTVREMRREVAVATAKSSPEFKEVVEEDELTGDKVTKQVAVEPEIVKLQNEVNSLLKQNKGIHEEFLDMMRYTEAFKDVDTVCTTERVADIIDMASARLAKEHNILPAVAELAVQRSLYSMSSPYKYLYKLIKDHHPDFKKPAQEAKPVTPAASPAPAQQLKPVNAPSSVVAVPKDSTMNTGWTAARIDALDEDELSKVPPDIYTKYMRNELP